MQKETKKILISISKIRKWLRNSNFKGETNIMAQNVKKKKCSLWRRAASAHNFEG